VLTKFSPNTLYSTKGHKMWINEEALSSFQSSRGVYYLWCSGRVVIICACVCVWKGRGEIPDQHQPCWAMEGLADEITSLVLAGRPNVLKIIKKLHYVLYTLLLWAAVVIHQEQLCAAVAGKVPLIGSHDASQQRPGITMKYHWLPWLPH